MAKALDTPSTRGRKTKQQCRSEEFRQRLQIWKQTPEVRRPSLRALARELGTSHQLLTHYLSDLENWEYEERYRQAQKKLAEICTRAKAEKRVLTPWEQQQILDWTREAMHSMLMPKLLGHLEQIKQQAKRGPLRPAGLKTLKMLANHEVPGAQELLHECSQKKQKNNLPSISDRAAKSFRNA